MFCCCVFTRIFASKEQKSSEQQASKNYFTKLKTNLKKFNRKRVNEDVKSIYAMVQLLKRQGHAVDLLSEIRVNPKVNRMDPEVKSNKQQVRTRNDLEFYLPQLLSHYLRSDLSPQEERDIKQLLINCCQINMFFAHRTWFNLKACMINKENNVQFMKTLQLLSELEVIMAQGEEKLFIANSEQLIKLILKTQLSPLMDSDCYKLCQDEEKKQSREQLDSAKKKSTKIGQSFWMSLFSSRKTKESMENKGIQLNSMQAQSLLNSSNDYSRPSFDEETENLISQINNNSYIFESFNFKFTPYLRALKPGFEKSQFLNKPEEIKTKSFFSTPNFISDLTEVSVAILSSQDKMKFLHNSLRKMNQNLPALCYLPLLSRNQRNFIVLRIAEMESRLFITAEKAPFLICLEVFQPMELQLEIQKEQAKQRPRAFEILNRFNILNKDFKKMLHNIDSDLSKAQYVKAGAGDVSDKNVIDKTIEQRKNVNMAKYIIDKESRINAGPGTSAQSARDKQEMMKALKDDDDELISLDERSESLSGRPSVPMNEDIGDEARDQQYYSSRDLDDELVPDLASQLLEQPNHHAMPRQSVNEHYGFYQNQDQITERNEMSECQSQSNFNDEDYEFDDEKDNT